jgi:hypothetical protein
MIAYREEFNVKNISEINHLSNSPQKNPGLYSRGFNLYLRSIKDLFP